MKLQFSGKKLLVLGGNSELGLTLIEQAIENHLYPIVTYRSEEGREQISETLRKHRQKYGLAFFDLGDYNSIHALIKYLDGDCDYMVDFAHSDYEELIASGDDQEISAYFERNIASRALLLKQISRLMLAKRKGRLVYVSSTAAVNPNPGQGLYAASKLAGEALYKNIGIEMGQKGITTVSLRPGYVNTGRGKKFVENNKKDINRVPIKRLITKEEIITTIMFLLSDMSSALNAVEIIMDGGLTSTK